MTHASRQDVPVSAPHRRFRPVSVDVSRDPDGVLRLQAKERLLPYPDRFQDHLWRWAKERPSQILLAERRAGQEGWASLTYAEAAEQVSLVAQALAERNLGPERPILVLSGNAIQHQVLGLAAMCAGVPFAPISVAYSLISQDLSKLKYITKLLDPGLVYAADAARFARALTVPDMQGREIVVGTASGDIPHAKPFAKLLAGGSAAALKQAADKVGPETIAKFLFTSGSTGIPKGVIITQRMINANMKMFEQVWPFVVDRPPVMVDWLPWSHVFGGNHNIGQVLRSGGTLYIDDGRPLAGEFERTLRNLRELSPTMYLNVPKGFELLAPVLANDRDLCKRFFADLDAMFYAGATLPQHLWDALTDIARRERPHDTPSMISSWGLTETAPGSLALNRHDAEIGNIGPPLPGQEVKLVPNGGKLEIRVRGPNITPGYWRMPELTQQAFDDEGYFITGDAVAFVDDGDASRGFRFNGRVVEDFKLSSGTRVHVAEVWARARQALGTQVFDVVVAAPDRDDLGLLIFPPAGRTIDDVYRDALREALMQMNGGITASSRAIARALVLREPPSLDAGEITDKGSLNSRGIRERRATDVARLYDDADPEVIKP
jgi:feruloyl-CoA synthase